MARAVWGGDAVFGKMPSARKGEYLIFDADKSFVKNEVGVG